MIKVFCSHCSKPVDEVAYVVTVVDAERLDVAKPITRAHLHWDCLPQWGRSKEEYKP